MTKYKNEWDVYVRQSGAIEITSAVRVRGDNFPETANGYLIFSVDKDGAKPDKSGYVEQVQTAMFPHQSVSRVIRVTDDDDDDSEDSDFKAGYTNGALQAAPDTSTDILTDELIDVEPVPVDAGLIVAKDPHTGEGCRCIK